MGLKLKIAQYIIEQLDTQNQREIVNCLKSVILKEIVKLLTKQCDKQPTDIELSVKLPDGSIVTVSLVFKKKSLELLKSS